MNYNLLMEEEIEKIKSNSYVPTLLLHACCAPCSSACIERLADFFKITILFYNPNITDEDEYYKRYRELERFVDSFDVKYKIDVIDGGYDSECFFEMAKGLEDSLERGKRCYKCYELRIGKTKEIADRGDFDYFTTTLSLSPYKVVSWINEIGSRVAGSGKSKFLNCDFKKRNGYKRSIELSSLYNLYRQDYCGCIYSKNARYKNNTD